ncbi:MAG: hypothetical protein IJA86_02350 [Clostridia bacterium]|nr:hypothetical protein [Clostridia bacterium]
MATLPLSMENPIFLPLQACSVKIKNAFCLCLKKTPKQGTDISPDVTSIFPLPSVFNAGTSDMSGRALTPQSVSRYIGG